MNTFIGAQDSDSAPEFLKDGDYISALNMSNSTLLRPGSISALPSGLNVPYVWPSGDNEVLGAHEDRQTQSVIVFVWNSNDSHRILKIVNNSVIEVAKGSGLRFVRYRRIHSVVIIDGKHLYWTDGFSDGTAFQGEELRYIDIEKSTMGKRLSYFVHAGIPGNDQFSLGDTYQVIVQDGLEVTYTVPDGTYEDDPAKGLEWLGENIKTDFDTILSVEICDCKLKVSVLGLDTSFEIVATDANLIVVPDNFYGTGNIQYEQTLYGRTVPPCAPVPTYISTTDIEYNNVRNFCGQFRSRYVYDDGAVSAWSGVSMLPLNDNQVSLNAIRLDFTDPRLSDPKWLCMIRGVELAFRNGNDDLFKMIRRIPICEIGTNTNYFDFLNDQNYSVIPSDDITAPTGIQVLMNDHLVARGAMAMNVISDDNGDSHIVIGGLKEGYDCVECIDATFTPETYQEDCLIDISGTVTIVNDPSFPTDDPNYSKYPLGGFVVYLAGTRFFAVSDNPSDGSGDGRFIIRNVPKGKYSLRVAHYMCQYGDADGAQFNLLNGIEWQKTSAPVIDVAGGTAFNGVSTERLIDTTTFTGSEFDLDVESGFGDIEIHNAHHTHAHEFPDYGLLIEVYTMDNNGLIDTVGDRTEAIHVENQHVRFYPLDLVDGAHAYSGGYVQKKGDHNGYVWIWADFTLQAMRIYLSTWEPNAPSNSGPYFAPTDKLWQGTWKDIQDDTATSMYASPYDNVWNWFIGLYPSPSPKIFYFFNGDPAWSAVKRFTASSSVQDINGAPLANALVWMMQQGRPVYTNSLGEFSMTVFPYQGTNALGVNQNTYSTYLNDECANFPVGPSGTGGYIFAGFVLPSPMFLYGFAGGIIPAGRFVKSGGIYKMAVLYEDDFGRSCLSQVDTVHVPFHTQDGVYAQRRIRYSINSKPPAWATKYRILRTKDSQYEAYAQLPIADAIYCTIPDGYSSVNPTGYGSGAATHILLQIGVDDGEMAAGETLLMFRGNNADGYRSKTGDRVRYLLDENQDPVISGDVLDVAVVGEYIDNGKYYVIITHDQLDKEIKKNWVFEFYTPKGIQEEVYYETGVCLPIIDAGTSVARHKGITQDQNNTFSLPAEGDIVSGDTYWYRRDYVLYDGEGYSFTPENSRVRLLDQDPCEDIGRAFIYDPNYKERFNFNKIRVSGIYIPQSATNNVSVFGSADYKHINRTFGPIKSLAVASNIMLAICEFKSQSIYVGRNAVMDLSGNSFIGRNADLLSIADEMVRDAGTVNPESVCVQDGRIFWWDNRNATVWQYGPNGVVDLRGNEANYFRTTAAQRLQVSPMRNHVVSGFDRRYRQFFLTFVAAVDKDGPIPGKTNVLVESSDGWGFKFSPAPVDYCAVGNFLFIFGTEVINKMYHGAGHLNFLGVQYDGEVRFVENKEPDTVKDYFNIKVSTNIKVYSPAVNVLPCPQYPGGMASRIPAAYWGLFENNQYAPFLRDEADPGATFAAIVNPTQRIAKALVHGRYLKGNILLITLRLFQPLSGGYITFASIEEKKSNLG